MTKRHFVALAKLLKDEFQKHKDCGQHCQDACHALLKEMQLVCWQSNPKFDTKRFREAVLGREKN